MDYDVAGAFEDIELSIIKSLRNNMKRHIKEEYEEGLNWTQWQAEVLSGLSQYKAENQDVLKGYMGKINKYIDNAILYKNDIYSKGVRLGVGCEINGFKILNILDYNGNKLFLLDNAKLYNRSQLIEMLEEQEQE